MTQKQLANVGKTISEKNTSGILKQLAEAVKSRNVATSRLNNEAMARVNNNNWRVDHTEELASQVQAVDQADATAKLFENMAKMVKKIEEIQIPAMSTMQDNFVKVANSFVGPIIAGLGLGREVGKDMKDNREEAVYNREANDIVEENEDLDL